MATLCRHLPSNRIRIDIFTFRPHGVEQLDPYLLSESFRAWALALETNSPLRESENACVHIAPVLLNLVNAQQLLDGRDINDDGAANFQVPRLQNNRIDLEALSDADFRTMFRFTDKGDSESDPASSTSSTGSVWDISSIDNL
ncbi:hypothetical protein BCR41DRAFT_396736 [Lobosporangium transversale]|uniref:Uncharacterized protein n=1 Tax=Lobosporangium transversale TaxID=64571 RepID=A0A1Y2GMC7_9FUNG|nr:hypothetical protein BCR41DRAFT_396736 [Lobosporangium transversale]ORZ15011.1 hypothetical protein BCR41DRAFT_396736 [Lobosporangium transversale]|eukprot:XP_021881143.1 hypothetical protein BCR41DRAFT_396736 [Lobosporangium transversale]